MLRWSVFHVLNGGPGVAGEGGLVTDADEEGNAGGHDLVRGTGSYLGGRTSTVP